MLSDQIEVIPKKSTFFITLKEMKEHDSEIDLSLLIL